ncbi:hypothetical protein AX17_001704 [Amanita inopinata Kibby_2008]|nr:hypothetical protein AX17_001704 [Amanita inopinata Kibby_2008]
MTSNTSDTWSPRYGTATYTSITPSESPLSPSRYSYTSSSGQSLLYALRTTFLSFITDSRHRSSEGTNPTNQMRRITVSPMVSNEYSDDSYVDDNSIDEVEAALNSLDNDINNTEQALTEWSHGSSTGQTPSYTTGSFTASHTGTYTGSTSHISLPALGTWLSSTPAVGPGARLSRITERTEESRPPSGAFSAGHVTRQANTAADALRRSALLSGAGAHARSSTEPGAADPSLPPPGRTTELIAVFETQHPAATHVRAASAPGVHSPGPFYSPSQITSNTQTSTSYTYGSTSYGFHSRPPSPTKSRNGSSLSYTDTKPTMSSLLSPPPLPPKPGESKVRPASPVLTESRTTAGSYLSPSTYSPSTFTNTFSQSLSNTGTRTFARTDTRSYTPSETNTFTGTSTPTSTLRRPQTSPRSPLASVRNIVALWKERTPAASRPVQSKQSTSATTPSLSPPDGEGLFGIRRRVQRAGARLREAGLRTTEQPGLSRDGGENGDAASIRTARSGKLPPGFDIGELSNYAQSNETPLHIGLLWYLNVHAPPPYRWQRCQALLYPHMLLLSWLAPGGGRGIVALDLLNCTSVQSTPSPTHPSARDDVGTVAARLQSSERDGQPLMDMLVPFQMLYADGVERLAAESLLERQKWVNRVWEAVNRPISMPDSSSITRSPTGSIRTILSVDSRTSRTSSTSTGSRSTVYVPPLSTLTDIPDFQSDFSTNSHSSSVSGFGLSRKVSLVSSHHAHTVDDTAIQNQEYTYRGDPRHIPASRGNSLRRTGSMNDLDQEFARALRAKRVALGGSPVTVSSGPSLGQDVFVTPPPSAYKGSDRAHSDFSGSLSGEAFFSAGLSGSSSEIGSRPSSTYLSQSGDRTATGLLTDDSLLRLSGGGSDTQILTSTLSFRGTNSNSYLGDSRDQSSYTSTSPSGLTALSRAREVRRRLNRVSSRSLSTNYTEEFSDRENSASGSGSYTYSGTPASQSYGLQSGNYTPESGSYTAISGSYTPGTGSYSSSQSYTPGSGSYTLDSGGYTTNRSYTASGNYTPSGSSTDASGNGSRSGQGSFTPGSETGYDVCPSSDLTGLTPPTSDEYSSSPALSSPMYVAIGSDHSVEVELEKFVTASQDGSDYLTAEVPSSGESIASFDTCPTIPSESQYTTAGEESTAYSTARSPSKVPSTEYLSLSELAPASEYVTAGVGPSEPEEIPSEESTPRLSSLQLSSEEHFPDLQSVHSVPSRVPTIKSLASSIAELSLQPQNIPLPPSVVSESPGPPLPPTPLLPPLPATPTSSLQPTPSVSSAEESSGVPTPMLLRHLPPLPPSPAPLASEGDESLLSSLSSMARIPIGPDRTPSSPSLSSAPREAEPITATGRTSVVPSLTESSLFPVNNLPSTSSSPSSPPPPSPMMWARDNETDHSYDSSHLQPSPSMMSIAVPEGPDHSFETSFLRPSGSVGSSVNKLSTLPASPSLMTVRMPFPQRAPGVQLTTGSTSSKTPTTQTLSSSSSSFSSDLSSSLNRMPSIVSQSSVGYPLDQVEEEESVAGAAPRTISTLLSTPRASLRSISPSVTPTPIPPRAHITTPEGSIIVSVSTPRGSGGTEQVSLRTEESVESLPTPRDIVRNIDRLAEDLRRYDDTRGKESKDIATNVNALREELQDLSNLLHRSPPPNVVRVIEQRIGAPTTDTHTRAQESRSVGGSTEITRSHYLSPRDIPDSVVGALTRSSSITSVGSFLSSHHSDDLSLYGYPGAGSPFHPMSDIDSDLDEESSFVSSSEITPSVTAPALPLRGPRTRSAASSVSLSTVRPTEQPNLTSPLNAIREQLANLLNGQSATNQKLDSFDGRPPPEISLLQDKISRVEGLLYDLIERFENHPVPRVVSVPIHQPAVVGQVPQQVPQPESAPIQDQQPATIDVPPAADSERDSLVSSDESSLIRQLESQLLTPPTVHAPRPSFAEQLQEILSSTANIIPPNVQHPPHLNRFTYEPLEGGMRPRSTSPASLESLLQRPMSVPTIADDFHQLLRNLPREPRVPLAARTGEPATGQAQEDTGPPPRSAEEDAWDGRMRDMARRRGMVPPPRPVFAEERPPSAPGALGGDEAQGRSWYLQRPDQSQPAPTTQQGTDAQRMQQQTNYVPMPAGPTYVQLPPIFEQLMSFVRESHVAQTATYNQQQDLSRYMRELNEWLARDVNDRQDELRGVTARLDYLTNALLNLQSRGPESTIGESEESTGQREQRPQFMQPQIPMPEPQRFHPDRVQSFVPVVPAGVHQQGVLAPVIPPTPSPDFEPVIPGRPVGQPHVVVTHPSGMPPPPTFIHVPGPGTVPPAPHESPQPFIPPQPASFGERPVTPNVIMQARSSNSSSVSSTSSSSSGRTRRTRRDRRSRTASGGRRTRSSTPRPYRQPTHLSYESPESSESSRDHRNSQSPARQSTTYIIPPPVPSAAPQHMVPAIPLQSLPQSAQTAPDVHVIPPSTTTLTPGTPRHPELQPLPQQPTIIINQPPQQAVPGVPFPGGPLPYVPHPSSQVGPGPIIFQASSRPSSPSGSSSPSSRRSSSRGHRSRRSRRSSSRRAPSPRSYTGSYLSTHPPVQPVLPIPTGAVYTTQPVVGQVYPQTVPSQVIVRTSRSRSSSRSSSPSRHRRSHGPTIVAVPGTAPGTQTPGQAPIVISPLSQAPIQQPLIQPFPGQQPFGQSLPVQQQPTIIHVPTAPRSRSSSPRSSVSHPAAILQPALPPVINFPEGSRGRTTSRSSHDHSHGHSLQPTIFPVGQAPTYPSNPSHAVYVREPGRHSRSPPIFYPSDHSRRDHGRRHGRWRSPSYSHSPRHRHHRHYSYSRSPSPSGRRSSRYSPPISRSPSPRQHRTRHDTYSEHSRSRHHPERRHGRRPRSLYSSSLSRESPDREYRSPSPRPRTHSYRPRPLSPSVHRSRSPTVSRSSARGLAEHHRSPSPTERGSRRGPPSHVSRDRPTSPRTEQESHVPTDMQSSPRASRSPSPLPRRVRSSSQRQRGPRSRSPTPTRSPGPRYVPGPRDRGEEEPITVIVPRRERSPTIVSLAPESEHAHGAGGVDRGAPSQRSASEEFSARPSFYSGSRRPSASRRPTDFSNVPRDEEESYRGAPAIEEPSRRRASGRTISESIPSRRATPLDVRQAEEQQQQLQRLNEVESRVEDVEASMREAEDRREFAFRQNEDDRYRLFLENQERRDQEARERSETLLHELDSRLAALLPTSVLRPADAAVEETEAAVGDTQSMIDSVRTASQEAAMQYSRDIQEIVKAEREEFSREREAAVAERDHLLAEAEAERHRLAEEREVRIKDLEEQLASVKQELEDEKQRRLTEEAETQERQRQELEERDEALRSQLGDITNLIHDQRQVCEVKKDLMEAQWEEKQRRRLDKDAKWIELRDMVLKLHEDLENDRARTEEYRQEADSKPGFDKVIEELARQNAEQRELLANLSESWRADCIRHHEETINAVRQTAQEQVPFNVQGYLDEFSKALATEVRMLLGEVGKLREERRALQHELGFLLTMKSKYGPGGEFEPEWKPGAPGGPPGPPGDAPPPEPQPPAPEQPTAHVRPGWRPVPGRRKKKKEAPVPSVAAVPVVDPRHQIQSWATWQPDPNLAPTPPSIEPTLLVPNRGSPGLFGPRSPRSSVYA